LGSFHDTFEDLPNFEFSFPEKSYFNEYGSEDLEVKVENDFHQSFHDYCQYQSVDHYSSCSQFLLPHTNLPFDNVHPETKLDENKYDASKTSVTEDVPRMKDGQTKSSTRSKRHSAKALNIVHWTADMVNYL